MKETEEKDGSLRATAHALWEEGRVACGALVCDSADAAILGSKIRKLPPYCFHRYAQTLAFCLIEASNIFLKDFLLFINAALTFKNIQLFSSGHGHNKTVFMVKGKTLQHIFFFLQLKLLQEMSSKCAMDSANITEGEGAAEAGVMMQEMQTPG